MLAKLALWEKYGAVIESISNEMKLSETPADGYSGIPAK